MSKQDAVVPVMCVELDGVRVKVPVVGVLESLPTETWQADTSAKSSTDEVIVFAAGVPNEPAAFAHYLEQWHREHNPDYFRFKLAGGVA